MALAAPPDLTDTAVPVQRVSRTYPRGLYIEPHEHDWGQVLYAMSGVMWVETPNEALVVPPQRAVWLPPGVPHGIRVVSDLEMRNIYLRPALAQTLENTVQVFEVAKLLRELIVSLVAEQGKDSEYYDALVRLALLELKRAKRSLLKVPMPDESDRRLMNVCHAVMVEPSIDVPFEQHAENAGASVRTLSRLFQSVLGMGFAEWRRQVQLATAVAEIIQGVPVSTIARAMGYSPSSFSDMFRRELGVSPSQYPLGEQSD
ncbi:helix-turn-helix transcriptional regulator [Pseudomonas sp. GD03842]|uniref:AraC family transcriptional regulator n=1 Tax=unclassified Pseudomonas TaxID=196821 RepID=UPI000D356704|nr:MULTISPECIES: helix-turn-helix transcriptional regulator [unclassified Pseudomonas]MDH0745794.1 helix-turn-helix transcriptional regulator [Pseudomonas sp. GD03842]RAU48767.1 AraC family transcriptional regulator [Pseudomonas sp. RIT 409]RAU53973.1 AraC family transcriptional regulator [Pseudomonas sp. RIT 412]